MKDHILEISPTFVIIWVVAKSLQQDMVSRVMSEHTLERNRTAVKSSTALSLSKLLEIYKNTQEHIQVKNPLNVRLKAVGDLSPHPTFVKSTSELTQAKGHITVPNPTAEGPLQVPPITKTT